MVEPNTVAAGAGDGLRDADRAGADLIFDVAGVTVVTGSVAGVGLVLPNTVGAGADDGVRDAGCTPVDLGDIAALRVVVFGAGAVLPAPNTVADGAADGRCKADCEAFVLGAALALPVAAFGGCDTLGWSEVTIVGDGAGDGFLCGVLAVAGAGRGCSVAVAAGPVFAAEVGGVVAAGGVAVITTGFPATLGGTLVAPATPEGL